MPSRADTAPTLTRRDALAAGAGLATASTAGCLQRLRGVLGRDSPDRVSLTVATLPTDSDEPATRIGRTVVEHLKEIGVEAELKLLPEVELRREVLVNGNFDIFVDQCPTEADPDYLRTLLHSVYSGEAGWQNPFEFTNISIDDMLEAQTTTSGTERISQITEIQRDVAREQPFGIVAVPNDISAIRTDRYDNWNAVGLSTPLRYLAIDEVEEADTLRVATKNSRITKNLNPIAVEYRNRGIFTGLLYDFLGRRFEDEVGPWLAESWHFDEEGSTSATLQLRADQSWHDGRPITAADVAFTYRFLQDTAMGETDVPVPAPRFRSESSLVDAVTAESDTEVTLEFGDVDPAVAPRAFRVPVLPEHVWSTRTGKAEVGGVAINEFVTEALVATNENPIGSGPLRFKSWIKNESLVLERFDDHFLVDDPPEDLPDTFQGGLPYEELSARSMPSEAASVELLAADQADVTVANTDGTVVPRIGKNEDLGLLVGRAPVFYIIGYNATTEPLNNPYFRRTVTQLVDKQYIVEQAFNGYASPATTPLEGTDWLASDLRWDGEDPEVPFVGEEGELDADRVVSLLKDAGFRFDADGNLLAR